MSSRARVLAFGSAGALVLAGVLSAVLINGLTGQIITLVLISLGLSGAVSLVFLEVGLSEDRELASERERRDRERARDGGQRRRPAWRRAGRSPRRPG